MHTQVGYAAGEIWHLLNRESGISVSKVKSALKKNYSDMISMMALGWLLRENKIYFTEEVKGKTVSYKVNLK